MFNSKKNKSFKIAVSSILVAATIYMFYSPNKAESKDAAPPPPSVKISAPLMQKITEYDEYTGRFEASQKVDIRSRISGYLQEVRFKDGQKVNKGDVLFVIDQRPLKIALERAKARFDLASKEYERAKSLQTDNVVSRAALDRVTAAYVEAKTALEDAKLNINFSEVKAPISGRVSRHLIDVGNLIEGGDQNAALLTTIVADQPIYFYFEASEQELLKYIRLDKEGKRVSSRDEAKPVEVKLQDETDFIHKGKMDFVDNQIDKNTGSIQGRAVFDNPDSVLISGLFGRLRIAGSDEYEAMLIPDEAVATNQNQKIVFMVNDKNIVEPRPIEIGGLHGDKWRIVKSGLQPTDKIIWSGLAKIRPNIPVTPQDITAQVAEKTE
jgi:membrane fusion protein, multidrug efflux system